MAKRTMRSLLVCALCLLALAPSGRAADGEFSRGTRWVRSHPFTTMALTIDPATFDPAEYEGANLNTVLAWKAKEGLFENILDMELPGPSFADWRLGDQRVFIADSGKALRELGWAPTIAPQVGIRRMVDWLDSIDLPDLS